MKKTENKTSGKKAGKPSNKTASAEYAVRLNEKLTVAKINKVLDAIDKNDGYCPCQPKGDGTKCHCEDFVQNKGPGEPCICKIYVKKAKPSKTKAAEDVCPPKKA